MIIKKEIKILNSQNLNIKIDLYKNSLLKKNLKYPLIIFICGFSGIKDTYFFNYFCEKFARLNFICLKFDFTNSTGLSDNDIKNISILSQINDLNDIFKYLEKNKKLKEFNFINFDKIILISHSFGGIIILKFLEFLKKNNKKYLDKIICTISLSMPYKIKKEIFEYFGTDKKQILNWEKNKFLKINSKYYKKTFLIPFSFYQEILDLKIEKLAKIKNHKLICGNLDKIVNYKDQEKYYKILIKPKQIKIINNLSHFYKNKNHLEEIIYQILIWIEKFLKN